ncbi:TPA: DUF6602 domain-containing protein [Vibrio campbellii]|nr:hypothetical protein [Vibrio campbellii]
MEVESKMTIRQNFLNYQRSINDVLSASEKRIRNLIGSDHWLTDGEHKEAILREVIAEFSPEVYRIGTGFVCYPSRQGSSGQVDILVTNKRHPTLYKKGELHFVTSDAVEAVVEVKTKLSRGQNLDEVVQKLSQKISDVRQTNSNCWAGLFIYDSDNLTSADVLDSLRRHCSDAELSAINCVALGANAFVRYWSSGHSLSGLSPRPVWHSYNLPNLAKSYFVSNLVVHLSPSLFEGNAEAWFAIRGQTGKERLRESYAFVGGRSVESFGFDG